MEGYDDAIAALQSEYSQLDATCARLKAELEKAQARKADVRGGLVSLSRLVPEARAREIMARINLDFTSNLTEAVREIMRASPDRLAPTEIRNALEKAGYNTLKHKNLMASIHTCLKRLEAQEEVSSFNDDGKTVYEWKR
jgi:phage shock protein A